MEESEAQGRELDWKYICAGVLRCVGVLRAQKVIGAMGVDEIARGANIKSHRKRILD